MGTLKDFRMISMECNVILEGSLWNSIYVHRVLTDFHFDSDGFQ